jgi:hypothetical protein
METVVYDQTPLADYLRGENSREKQHMSDLTDSGGTDEGEDEQVEWAPAATEQTDSSPPPSPGFAPTGRPMVRARFRNKIPNPLHLDIPERPSLNYKRSYRVSFRSLEDARHAY